MPTNISIDTAPLMQAIADLRKEVTEKIDALQASLATFVPKYDHERMREDFERRVRELEAFKAKSLGVLLSLTVAGGVVGSLLSLLVKLALR